MTTKQQKQLIGWLGLYVFNDKAMMPTLCETDEGFHVESDPVLEFDIRSREELVAALYEAIKRGNPLIPTPSPDALKQSVPVMQMRTKSKSWKEIERRTIHFSIEIFDENYLVTCSKRGADGLWSRDKELALDVTVPRSLGPNAIADAIFAHLQTRTDLPGLMFDITPRTAKGA